MKISSIYRILILISVLFCGCHSLMANRIKVGEAEIAIHIKCVDTIQLPQSLSAVILSSSIFDKAFEYDHYVLQKTDSGFIGRIPVDTEMVNVGLILRDSIQPYLLGMVTLSQEFPVTVECAFVSDSLIYHKINPEFGLNGYSLIECENNASVQASQIIMTAANYHLGLSEEEPDFTSAVGSDQLIEKYGVLKDIIRSYSFNGVKLPQDIEIMVDNILEYDFAGQWILSHDRLHPQSEIILPVGMYEFLSDIDKNKMYYDRMYFIGPYDFFKLLLEKYYKNIPSIDTSQVTNWKSAIKGILKENIENPSDEFLNMLVVTSYKMQLDGNNPLSQKQIENIDEGLPADHAFILKSINSDLMESLSKGSNIMNLIDSGFSLNEFVNESADKKFIYLDLWNTWCMPCVLELKERKLLDLGSLYPDFEFVSICDSSSDIEEWEKRSVMIKGKSVIINSDSMERIFNDYGMEPLFPTHLLLDRQGNLLKSSTGYMSNEELKSFLDDVVYPDRG